jgi:hypothetical protein
MNQQLLDNLAMLQDGLNEYITKDWKNNRTELDFMICSHQEMSELIDTTCDVDGAKHSLDWKWWKQKSGSGARTMDTVKWNELHQSVIDNIKIELTDLVFFTLSQRILEDLTDPDEPVVLSENDWLNFMSITANNLLQRPSMSLGIVLELSKKIDFNIAAYYIVKHLLNYYRQISKYGDGYEKIKNGKEDNELLHDIINDITVENLIIDFDNAYNLIASRFFEIFTAPKEKEITIEFWRNFQHPKS